MILSGKCKEEFLEYVYSSEDAIQIGEASLKEIQHEACNWLSYQDERFINALIVDYFDSVGIYVGIVYFHDFFDWRIHYTNYYGTSKSRQEATAKAIKKANEIRNNQLG